MLSQFKLWHIGSTANYLKYPENLFAAPALMNYSNKISKGCFGAGAGFTVMNGLKGRTLLSPEV
jgi:hypothetical protein